MVNKTKLRDWPVVVNDMTYLHEFEERFGTCTYAIGTFKSANGRNVVYLAQQRRTEQFVNISNHPRGGDFLREQGVCIAGFSVRRLLGRKIEVIEGRERDEIKKELLEHHRRIGIDVPAYVDML